MSLNAATPTVGSASLIDQWVTHQARPAAAIPEAGTRRRFDRRFRNPRFAPEFLERKLSPSTTIAVAAQMFIPTSALDGPINPTPPDGDGRVPDDDGTDPNGPPIPGA